MTVHPDRRPPEATLPPAAVRASRIAAGLLTVLIFWGTLRPQAPEIRTGFAMADKLRHALAFAGWAGVIAFGWN